MKLALAVILSLAFTPLAAQDHQKGFAAYADGDYATALQEWTPLAEAGDANAQNWLGWMYNDGTGVPQDHAEAAKWYKMAAEGGDVIAQLTMGFIYDKGRGVLQDNVMAHLWLNIASANENENAGEYRDRIAGLMTAEDISKAQSMARECMKSDYTDCSY